MTKKPTDPADDAVQTAWISARLSGCNCNPDIEVTRSDSHVSDVNVAHDDWCAIWSRRQTHP